MTYTDDELLDALRAFADEDCDWGPLGTADPDHWRLVERHRLAYETETDHTTTVETIQQRTLLDGRRGLDGVTLDMAAEQGVAIEWVCPECGRTATDLNAVRRCPDCDEPFREALP